MKNIKFTCQQYVSGGFQQSLAHPMAVGTPYSKIGDHINFLLPCPWSKEEWPEPYITGRWSVECQNRILYGDGI